MSFNLRQELRGTFFISLLPIHYFVYAVAIWLKFIGSVVHHPGHVLPWPKLGEDLSGDFCVPVKVSGCTRHGTTVAFEI